MFIRPLPKKLEPSGAQDLNFLWKDDLSATYIMDNHLAALWCWLDELDEEAEYSLFHLDWHWDCTDMPDEDIIRLANTMDFEIFKALKSSRDPDMSMVRYDNYIDPLFFLRKRFRKVHITSNQDKRGERIFDPNFYPDFDIYLRPELFLARLRDNFEDLPNGKVLFNLDIDFFFLRVGGRHMQAYSDEFICAIIDEVVRIPKSRRLVTIAWSPEFSGSWEQAARVCEIVCRRLGTCCPASEVGRVPH